MSADDLLYEPVKQRINAICISCHKYFDYDVNDPCPSYCLMTALGSSSGIASETVEDGSSAGTEEMVEDSCCGSGECGCFFYMGWQAFAG